ncbi:MAG: hypothetical protein O2780_04330 [Proteobacteria bacterium]|jgi:hypothetical protein|nr:hypothetical protein [Pseudomonadota bacterium]MDA1302424.1 hypothetical protein [Pseudomonadota bacterium]
MELEDLRRRFTPAIDEILDRCKVTEEMFDKERFQIFIATIWGNAVLEPERSGLNEGQLELLHDFLNEELQRHVGKGTTITSSYEFIIGKRGDESLTRLQITQRHREFLYHFARLILGREVELP